MKNSLTLVKKNIDHVLSHVQVLSYVRTDHVVITPNDLVVQLKQDQADLSECITAYNFKCSGEFIYNQLTIEVPRKALENVKLPNTKKRLMIEVPREGAPKKAKLPNAKKNIPTKDICEKFKKILTNCIFEGSYILELIDD